MNGIKEQKQIPKKQIHIEKQDESLCLSPQIKSDNFNLLYNLEEIISEYLERIIKFLNLYSEGKIQPNILSLLKEFAFHDSWKTQITLTSKFINIRIIHVIECRIAELLSFDYEKINKEGYLRGTMKTISKVIRNLTDRQLEEYLIKNESKSPLISFLFTEKKESILSLLSKLNINHKMKLKKIRNLNYNSQERTKHNYSLTENDNQKNFLTHPTHKNWNGRKYFLCNHIKQGRMFETFSRGK